MYCIACGQSLEKIIQASSGETRFKNEKSSRRRQATDNETVRPFQTETLVGSLKASAITIAAFMVVSLVISMMINQAVRSSMEDDLLGPLISSLKVVSMTDIFMLGHLANVDYVASAMFLEFYVKTNGSLYLFLLLPALILIPTGYLLHRNNRERSIRNRLMKNVSFAVVYAALVAVISMFSGISVDLSSFSSFGEEMIIAAEYRFINVFVNALILSVLFTSLGSLIGLSADVKQKNRQYGVSIRWALLNQVAGVVLFIVAGLAVFHVHEEFKNDETFVKNVVGSQVGGYMWNVAQFETLRFETTVYDEQVKASYSLLGGAKASEDEESFQEVIKELTGSFFWLIALVPLLLHFQAGNQLRKATEGQIIPELGVYAASFGLVNAAIVALANFSINTNFGDLFNVSLGFSVIGSFFFGAVAAFVIAYLAVLLTNRNGDTEDTV
ncbi:hypothetical protein [Halalkalibacter krulwichiae]|uniref:hypothetical protein n=1 Tax=Halalkalibacter krulwichiae TaxID=199441 RepID=UPI001F1B240C|nr:hypothetical protein [Halalkalibacter krulwichiae]